MTFRTPDALRSLLLKLGVPTGVAAVGLHVVSKEHVDLALPTSATFDASAPSETDEPHTHTEVEEPQRATESAGPTLMPPRGDDLSWSGNSLDVTNEIARRRPVRQTAFYDAQPSPAPLFYEAVRST